MGKKLYVGNLAFSVTDAELEQLLGEHGEVESANVVTDRETGRSQSHVGPAAELVRFRCLFVCLELERSSGRRLHFPHAISWRPLYAGPPSPPRPERRNGTIYLTGVRQAAVVSARLNHPCIRGLEVV